MKIYDQSQLWQIIEAKVAAGLEVSDSELDLAIAYIMDDKVDAQGYDQALSVINYIKKL